MAKVTFEVEYEITPFRHVYVTCPKCNNKFVASEVMDAFIRYERDITKSFMVCPICKAQYDFTYNGNDQPVIREVGYPKCAEGAKFKREVWE